jgi:hypothetical protein
MLGQVCRLTHLSKYRMYQRPTAVNQPLCPTVFNFNTGEPFSESHYKLFAFVDLVACADEFLRCRCTGSEKGDTVISQTAHHP